MPPPPLRPFLLPTQRTYTHTPLLQDHRPHAIVIGASNPEARTLEQDLVQILDSILLDNPRFNIGGFGPIEGRLLWRG